MVKTCVLSVLVLGVALCCASATAQDFPHGDLELECQDCHTEDGWTPTRAPLAFKHGESVLPMTGSHKKVKCRSCHATLDFAKVATACADCHRDTHRGEFGYSCENCHLPKSWDNRRRMWDRHAGTLFPLTGVHATLDCESCHFETPPFQFALAPVDCVSCHEDDYRATNDPDHELSGFPLECQICHDSSSWDARGFQQHDAVYFPINSGTHAGEWSGCNDCHVVSGSFQIFECITCHEHSESRMNQEHDDEPGYVYESSMCYGCHPRGIAEDD